MNDESDGAYAQSEDAIEHFAGSLSSFAASLGTELEKIQRQGRNAIDCMERRRDHCAARVEELQAELAAEESDDALWDYSIALSAERAELERLRGLCSLAQQRFVQIASAIARLESLSRDVCPMACKFLMDKVALLRAYQALRLELDGSADSVGELVQAEAKTPGQGLSESPDITQVALPSGFVWVRLDEIALKDELKDVRDADDFSKVGYDEMKVGAQHFIEQVLPLVRRDRTLATSEYFAELDRKAGVPYEGGIQRVFEAFLGRWSPIYLCRGPAGGQYTVTNGRHRIKVASDLGWPAVPAQVKDVSNHARRC